VYLNFVYAQKHKTSCVLIDPPVYVATAQRDERQARQDSKVEISDVTKTLLKAYKPSDFSYRGSDFPIDDHFTNSMHAAHFLVENSNPLVSRTILSNCDHYTCLDSNHVRASVQNILFMGNTPDWGLRALLSQMLDLCGKHIKCPR
jgi:hypothetical protein